MPESTTQQEREAIHLVLACTNYEGSSPVKAFTTLAEAEGYIAAIQAHEATRPESPSDSIDTPEGEAAFDAWWELQQAWASAHPAKGFDYYDSFAVVQVECKGLAARSLPPTDAPSVRELQDARPMWADCESRGPMIRNSLAGRIQDLERAASRSRRAYKQPFMNEPMQWYANALDEAAAVLSRHLAALARHEGEGNGVS